LTLCIKKQSPLSGREEKQTKKENNATRYRFLRNCLTQAVKPLKFFLIL